MSDQTSNDAVFIASDYRANFKTIVAKNPHLTKYNRGRLIASVSYNAGQVLGIVTATGFLKAYTAGASDGSQNPVGILADDAVVDASQNGSEARVIVGGQLFQDFLIGLDSGAITALGGKSYTEGGIPIFNF